MSGSTGGARCYVRAPLKNTFFQLVLGIKMILNITLRLEYNFTYYIIIKLLIFYCEGLASCSLSNNFKCYWEFCAGTHSGTSPVTTIWSQIHKKLLCIQVNISVNKTNLNKYPLYEEEEIPIILTKYLVIIVFGLVLSWFSYFKHFSIILVNFKDFLISCTELSS